MTWSNFYCRSFSCRYFFSERSVSYRHRRLSIICNNKMSSSEEAREILDKIPQVVIDGPGKVFKYILIQVNVAKESKQFVRGSGNCPYHGDIMDEFTNMVEKLHPQIKSKCLGGGRIDHSDSKIIIYGYSQGFGRAKHEISAELVRAAFPNKTVEWNNDGY